MCPIRSAIDSAICSVEYIGGKPMAFVEWEKRNAGMYRQPVYLYPHIIAHPDRLTFVSNYVGIRKTFALTELEKLTVAGFTTSPASPQCPNPVSRPRHPMCPSL